MNYNKIAVHAYNQALLRSPQLKAQEEGARMDAGFDGGEFSSGFHAQVLWDLELEIAGRVGARFGLTADQMRFQWQDWYHGTLQEQFCASAGSTRISGAVRHA